MNNNDILIKYKIKEFFNNNSFLVEKFFIDLGKENIYIYFLLNDLITVYESFPIHKDKILITEKDINDIIKNPSRIIQFSNESNSTELYNYINYGN